MNNTANEISGQKEEMATPIPRLTLRKGEKLRHRSLLESLFKEGHSLYDFPLRLKWRILDEKELEMTFRNEVPERIDPLQMLITVPKRKRRHAVDRVLMRRRIREAYRLNRLPLKEVVAADPKIRTLGLAFIYLSDTNIPYETVERKMKALLAKLGNQLAHMASPGYAARYDNRKNHER